MQALVCVPFVAADLVDGALAEARHMKRVKADLGVGDAGADRFLIAPLMSIETARMLLRRLDPSSSKNACNIGSSEPKFRSRWARDWALSNRNPLWALVVEVCDVSHACIHVRSASGRGQCGDGR